MGRRRRRRRQWNSTHEKTNNSIEDLVEMRKMNTQLLTPTEQ
jgi:hypothetical protein